MSGCALDLDMDILIEELTVHFPPSEYPDFSQLYDAQFLSYIDSQTDVMLPGYEYRVAAEGFRSIKDFHELDIYKVDKILEYFSPRAMIYITSMVFIGFLSGKLSRTGPQNFNYTLNDFLSDDRSEAKQEKFEKFVDILNRRQSHILALCLLILLFEHGDPLSLFEKTLAELLKK